jgi:DNA-binding MarR family transcriptional regulator
MAAGPGTTPKKREAARRVDAGVAAHELLHVVMLVMRTVSANMRRSPGAIAPAQMGSLMHVAAGPCTMSSLARHLAVSLPTISRSVDMLVRRGWFERWVDRHDRRQTMVRLTPQGRRVLTDIKKARARLPGAAHRRRARPARGRDAGAGARAWAANRGRLSRGLNRWPRRAAQWQRRTT